jgi:hypothetical protein
METEIQPGINDHKWKSPDIDGFIRRSKATVDGLYETVNKMKDSLKRVNKCLDAFN